MVVLLWLLGGLAGLLLGVAIVVVELPRPLPPRRLLGTALLLLLALPLVVLARGLPTRASLSPDFAAGSLLPHVLAGSALTLLVLGVLRDVRASLPPDADRRAIAPRGPAGELQRADDPGAGDGRARR
jgi:hypothetical protein